jgi:hypothetical protein
MALTELTLDVTLQRSGVTYSQDGTTPVFTVTDDAGDPVSHDLTVGAEISVTKSTGTVGTPSNTTTILGTGQWNDEGYYWEFGSGKKYVIASVEKTNTFTVEGEFDTSADETTRTIEYHPTKIEIEEVVVVEEVDSGYEWAQVTLGQNEKIAEVAGAASKASALLDANLQFVKAAMELGKILLLGVTNPQLLLLVAIADEIDNFVNDLKSTGFFILEVTPTGNEVLPTDAEGDPIGLLFSPITLAANYTVAASAGLLTEFNKTLEVNGITALNGVFDRSSYQIPIGKSEASDKIKKGKDDDILALRDDVFGLTKMTPSQVIATMVAAMDDQLDDRRPQFSDSADVAAIIVVIGFSDLTKNVKSLKEVLELFVGFFGGENGLFTKGIKGLLEGITDAFDALQDTESYNSEIIVENICGVRGTDEDKKTLRTLIPQSQWNEFASDSSKWYYNFPDEFEVGDLVIGPEKDADGKAFGYVSKVGGITPATETSSSTTTEEDSVSGAPYVSQKLTISCLSRIDKFDFDNFANGAMLQKVAYIKNEGVNIDQNSMEVINEAAKNGYKLIQNLSDAEAATVAKVKRESGNVLLTITGTESVIETHGQSGPGGEGFTTKNLVQGRIPEAKEQKKKQAPPPNFKAVKLEDLLQELKRFFAQIQAFTDSMRAFAADAIAAINQLTKYLEDKIKELEELNDAIQGILRIFTTGLPDAGVYSLSIPSTSGGNNAIKNALQSATNGPPNSLDFSAGFMMMGGAAAIDPLLSLISGD